MSIQPRERVRSVPEYHPPLGGRAGLRLDFNENTLACSPAVTHALRNITAEELTRYPERARYEALAAEHLGLQPQRVVLTNGVDEAIHVLCQAFLDRGDELLLPVPTYSMYEIYASATDATVVRVAAETDFRFPHGALRDAITPRTKLIAIANPNSPTGSVASRQELIAMTEAAPHAIVLVDEAYFHFHGETVIDLIDVYPNLVVARTFSKAYGLASLRIGLLAAQQDTLQWVRRVLSPYSVNHVALACMAAALEDRAFLDAYVEEVLAARSQFCSEMDRLAVRHWPSRANFILARIGACTGKFVTTMREHGLLVRDRSSDPGCEGCVRITVGTRDQMRVAARAIEMFLAEAKHD